MRKEEREKLRRADALQRENAGVPGGARGQEMGAAPGGIAGIPGTATMAASVSLSGVGMASSFSLIGPILAIDPLIDMMRTMVNVSGSVTNSIMIDKQLGTLDMTKYNSH